MAIRTTAAGSDNLAMSVNYMMKPSFSFNTLEKHGLKQLPSSPAKINPAKRRVFSWPRFVLQTPEWSIRGENCQWQFARKSSLTN
jgi:hypothetical protein